MNYKLGALKKEIAQLKSEITDRELRIHEMKLKFHEVSADSSRSVFLNILENIGEMEMEIESLEKKLLQSEALFIKEHKLSSEVNAV